MNAFPKLMSIPASPKAFSDVGFSKFDAAAMLNVCNSKGAMKRVFFRVDEIIINFGRW